MAILWKFIANSKKVVCMPRKFMLESHVYLILIASRCTEITGIFSIMHISDFLDSSLDLDIQNTWRSNEEFDLSDFARLIFLAAIYIHISLESHNLQSTRKDISTESGRRAGASRRRYCEFQKVPPHPFSSLIITFGRETSSLWMMNLIRPVLGHLNADRNYQRRIRTRAHLS
jgi:hypothetical protein